MAGLHKDAYGYAAALAYVIFMPLVAIAIAVRIYVRKFVVKSFGSDDWCMLIAVVAFIAAGAPGIMINKISAEPPSFDRAIRQIQMFNIGGICYGVVSLIGKLALCMGLLRFLQERWERLTCYSMMVLFTLSNIAFIVLLLAQCADQGVAPSDLPRAEIEGRCKRAASLSASAAYTQNAATIVLDIVMICLPLPLVLRSTMNFRAKTTVVGIVVLASGATVCSMVRLAYLHEFVKRKGKVDSTILVNSTVELGVFLICGCLATFRPLLLKLFSSMNQPTQDTLQLNEYNVEKDTPDSIIDTGKRSSGAGTL